MIRSIMPILVATIALLSSNAMASVIFSHLGNADPVSEGWSSSVPGPGTSATPLTNDAGTGFDAWSVSDTSNANGSVLGYTQTPNAAQNAQAATSGWTLRTRLRVANDSDAVNNHGSIVVDYIVGGTQFLMGFGSEADGDPIVSLWNNLSNSFDGRIFTLQGTGGGYHLYELVFDSLANSADLFVDGSEVISDYSGVTGAAGTVNRVAFGALSSFDTGQGNYHLVEWEVNNVSEPSTLALLALSLAGIGFGRRKMV